MKPKLYATPLSHFARKVRIVLSELEVPFELLFVGDLLSSDPSDFGGNPILRIPTFRDDDHWIVESDQITRYIVERHDPSDRLGRLHLLPDQRNALSMINAAMAAEVEILLSTRSGIEDIESYEYFRRYFEVIRRCLRWLESEGPASWVQSEFSYLDIALTCMWDHLDHYDTVENLDRFSWIRERVTTFAARESVVESAPGNQQLPGDVASPGSHS